MSYTNGLDKPSDYFNTKLYTGTGSSLSISSLDFSPDFTWIKGRSGATEHVLTDSVRGVTEELSSNDTGAEETVAQGLTAFNSDGFTVGTDGSYNTSSATYVGWSWLAGGTASSNTDGDITSTVSANTTSGFSIVSYTGTGANATVGHGLSTAPSMVIVKGRDTAGKKWSTGHNSIGWTNELFLNTIDASASAPTAWNNTDPTSSVVSLGTGGNGNSSGENYIMYCFAEKQGYSKFGSYTGNGNADGTFVYTGFKPSFILVKSSSAGSTGWNILDNKRDPENVMDTILQPNNSNADANDANKYCDFLSNGFKWRATGGETNGSGTTYIYMAFASEPFTTSSGVPCTAR